MPACGAASWHRTLHGWLLPTSPTLSQATFPTCPATATRTFQGLLDCSGLLCVLCPGQSTPALTCLPPALLLASCMYICVCMCGCVHAMTRVWRSEGQVVEVSPLLQSCGSWRAELRWPGFTFGPSCWSQVALSYRFFPGSLVVH